MGYPIKTSNDQWLVKARELYYKRVNINIEDDTNFFTKENLHLLKEFHRVTLPFKTLYFLSAFYLLAIICIVLGYMSATISSSPTSGIIISSIGTIVCLLIPTIVILRNKSPQILSTESGYKIIFNRKVQD